MFYVLPYIMWLVIMSSDVTCCVTAWSHHSNPNPNSKNRIKENKIKIRKENRKKPSPLLIILILPPLQGFSSGETDFHFHQFLSNFFKYSSSNFLSSHLYNIFAIYFSGNFPLLMSFSSTISNFSCLLISAFILPSNSSNASLVFPKSSPFSHMSCSIVNLFHLTKYLSTPLIFLLFNIFSTSYSLTLSTSISLLSFFFCPCTCSLYHTI